MIEVALRSHLVGFAAVAALVGTRVHPTILPQAPALPAITYQLITERNVYSSVGHSGLTGPLIQVDSWAETFLEAAQLADAVKDALHAFNGLAAVAQGTTLGGTFCVRRTTFYEDDTQLHRVSADYFLWYSS